MAFVLGGLVLLLLGWINIVTGMISALPCLRLSLLPLARAREKDADVERWLERANPLLAIYRKRAIGLVVWGLVWFGLVWSGLVWFGVVSLLLECLFPDKTTRLLHLGAEALWALQWRAW